MELSKQQLWRALSSEYIGPSPIFERLIQMRMDGCDEAYVTVDEYVELQADARLSRSFTAYTSTTYPLVGVGRFLEMEIKIK